MKIKYSHGTNLCVHCNHNIESYFQNNLKILTLNFFLFLKTINEIVPKKTCGFLLIFTINTCYFIVISTINNTTLITFGIFK